MSAGRSGLMVVVGCCVASALCASALAQNTGNQPQSNARRAGPPAPRTGNTRSVYGPPAQQSGPQQSAPHQPAQVPRTARGGKLSQFIPQEKRPQASWGELTPEQDAALELVLQAWEKRSSEVKTLKCTFQCWKYDNVFGDPTKPGRVYRGVILYAAPDKGHYRLTEEAEDPTVDPPRFIKKEGEYWVCDGNAVYEFNHKDKQLIERRLPKELKGKAISNSPLPFVFGTTVVQMRQRYWMCLVTPPDMVGKEVWLRVEPKYPEDRANYQTATVVLSDKQMLPTALSLTLPGNGNRVNYVFDPPSVNNLLKKILGEFEVPATPRGWKRVVEEPPTPGDRPPPPGDDQAIRVPLNTKRK